MTALPATAEPTIRVERLCKRFGDVSVLQDVSLEVRPGEVLGLIGPNGGGKSTLLLAMAGLIRPSSGTVLVGGIAAADLALQATGTVGLITAEAGLYPLLTGRENLRYFGGLYGIAKSDVDTRIQPLLARLDVDDHVDRRVSSYSSGMRQKVSLLRALMLSPKVLLLDEPTANLDPVSTATIHGAVREQANQGIAVVLCTHDLSAAEYVCNRVAVLQHTIKAEANVGQERRSPEHGRLYQLYASNVREEE